MVFIHFFVVLPGKRPFQAVFERHLTLGRPIIDISAFSGGPESAAGIIRSEKKQPKNKKSWRGYAPAFTRQLFLKNIEQTYKLCTASKPKCYKKKRTLQYTLKYTALDRFCKLFLKIFSFFSIFFHFFLLFSPHLSIFSPGRPLLFSPQARFQA